jgi:prepilin-type N-terminal cleavage/methylation domain-containing protein
MKIRVWSFFRQTVRRDRSTVRHINNANGFTLIEVILALTIFALMGGIIYGAFALGHSAVEKSAANSTRSQKQRATADLLGSYVRSSFPYRESPQDPSIYFDGDSDSVTFVSAYSQSLGGRGMAKIQISQEEGSNGWSSIKVEETTPVRISGDAGSAVSHNIVLQDNVKDFRLDYLDPQSEDEKWEERWDGKEKRVLPRAVRISYTPQYGKEIRWVFPVMMSVLAQ